MFVNIEDLSLQGAFAQHPELLDTLPNVVTVAAIGGLAPHHLPKDQSPKDLLLHRIGMGSILTYGNRHRRTCTELGTRALDTHEDWEANTFPITLLFLRLTPESRFSFAADRRFHLSWQEQRLPNVPLCTLINGSWKDWNKYTLLCATDPSFTHTHRALLSEVKTTLDWLQAQEAPVSKSTPKK